MNNSPLNKYIHTRYPINFTATDIDLGMHKISNNHIRVVEFKRTGEGCNKSQDIFLEEIANIFKFALENGYRNKKGVPKLEVVKIIGNPVKLAEIPNKRNKTRVQEVYDLKCIKVQDFITGHETILQDDEKDQFLSMTKEGDKVLYNSDYQEYYQTEQLKFTFNEDKHYI